MRKLIAALFVLPLAGCIPFSVDESYFFKPQKLPRKAADISQLDFVDQATITGPFSAARPPNLNGRPPATVVHEFMKLGGETIAVSHVKAANAAPNEPLIVYCPGNASDRYHVALYYTDKVLPWGEILMFDYPGYGDSSGKPLGKSFAAMSADMGPWIDAQAHGRPLVFWGHSIGGLVCPGIVAQSREADAVILETTGPSFATLAEDRKPSFAPFIRMHVVKDLVPYDTAGMLAGFKGKILVLGAGKDTTLPPHLAQQLADGLKAEGLDVTYWEYETANHHTAALNRQFAEDAKPFFVGVADVNR